MNTPNRYKASITLFGRTPGVNSRMTAYIDEQSWRGVEEALTGFATNNGIPFGDVCPLHDFIIYDHGARSMELTLGGRLAKADCSERGSARLVATVIETTEDGMLFTTTASGKTPDETAEGILKILDTEASERGITFDITKQEIIDEIHFGNDDSGVLEIPRRGTGSTFHLSATLLDFQPS